MENVISNSVQKIFFIISKQTNNTDFYFFKINHEKNKDTSISLNFLPGKLFICPTTGYYSKASINGSVSRLFTISPVTVLVAKNNLNDKAEQLKKYLDPATGFILGVTSKAFKKNCIELRLDNSLNNLGEEGYLLKVNPDKIILSAFNEKGIGWGIQTLRQLLPDQILRQATVKDVPWKIPCLEIKDSPHFKWRGLMLDCNQKWTDNYFRVYWLCQK